MIFNARKYVIIHIMWVWKEHSQFCSIRRLRISCILPQALRWNNFIIYFMRQILHKWSYEMKELFWMLLIKLELTAIRILSFELNLPIAFHDDTLAIPAHDILKVNIGSKWICIPYINAFDSTTITTLKQLSDKLTRSNIWIALGGN